MKCIKIEPGRAPEVSDVANTLKAMQAFVGGPIEAVRLGDTGLVAVVNEEGRLLDLPYTGCLRIRPIQDEILCGPVLIVRAALEAFGPVRDGDLERVLRIYKAVMPV